MIGQKANHVDAHSSRLAVKLYALVFTTGSVCAPGFALAAEPLTFSDRLVTACSVIKAEDRRYALTAMSDFARNDWTNYPGEPPYSVYFKWMLKPDDVRRAELDALLASHTGQSAEYGPKTAQRAGKILEWARGADLRGDRLLGELAAVQNACLDAPFDSALNQAAESGYLERSAVAESSYNLWDTLVDLYAEADDNHRKHVERAYRALPEVKLRLGSAQRAESIIAAGDGFNFDSLAPRSNCAEENDVRCKASCGQPDYKAWVDVQVGLGPLELTRTLSSVAARDIYDSGIDDPYGLADGKPMKIGKTWRQWRAFPDPVNYGDRINGFAMAYLISPEEYVKAGQSQLDLLFKTVLDGQGILTKTVTLVGLSLHNTSCKSSAADGMYTPFGPVGQGKLFAKVPLQRWGLVGSD